MLFAEWVQIGIKEKGRSIWDIRKHTTNWRNSGSYMSGSLTLPFKPHNTQILYLSLLLAYFFVKFEKIIRASLH